MPISAQYASATYALGAVCCWGISDFLGGYTARKFNSFFLAMLGHAGGFSMVFAIAAGNHLPLPSTRGIVWAMLAGASGGTALALFYRALAQGNMGLAAPVSTVIGAAIPAVFAIWAEGFPRPLTFAGFTLPRRIGTTSRSRTRGDIGTRFRWFLHMHEAGGQRDGMVAGRVLPRRVAGCYSGHHICG